MTAADAEKKISHINMWTKVPWRASSHRGHFKVALNPRYKRERIGTDCLVGRC